MSSRSYDFNVAKEGNIDDRNKFLMSFLAENLGISAGDMRMGEIFEIAYKTFLGANSYHSFYLGTKKKLKKSTLKEPFTKVKGLKGVSGVSEFAGIEN